MIQIQLPLSMTATAKLEGKDVTKKTKQALKAQQRLSDVAMAQSEALLASKRQPPKSIAPTSTESADKKETSTSLWWIHGQGYDLTDFVDRHPGGQEAILLGKGRDCTALVESYHAFSVQHWKVLEKYKTTVETEKNKSSGSYSSTSTETTRTTGKDRPEDFFYNILKERVKKELLAKGIDPVQDRGASHGRIAYYCLVMVLWLHTGYMHLSGSTLGSFLFAITGWLMGALGHDAGHFAASRLAWVNECGVWAMFFICNPILWQHQHTYGHHSFTNEFDHDPDLHHFHLLLRVHKRIRYESQFQYQSHWLYVLFAYLFVVFGTCFYIPWGVISTGTLYGVVDWSDQDRPTKNIGMRLHMALYLFIVVLVPLFTHETLSSAALAIYLHIATLGSVFALFSQINHLNEPSLESDMDSRRLRHGDDNKNNRNPNHIESKEETRRDPRLVHSWAAAQVETSNNFAAQSLFWHVLSNGLNHQIEHHLFPGLNHGHLHHIAPVVKLTCEEFGVEYKSYDTWSDLMDATLSWLDKMSVNIDFSHDEDESAAR